MNVRMLVTESETKVGVRPLTFERMALGLTLLAAVALALIRIAATDTPWHLATAQLAFESGWPTTNTFSYTHPDYTLYQQYPVYQTLLYLVYRVGGWECLSVLHAVMWVVIFVGWIRWGGSWQQACVLNLAWMLCLWGLGQRMILRPDVITILLFLCLLHLIEWYRRGRPWAAGLFVVVQLLMANSHQLFTIGLAAQGILLIHLVMVHRWGGRWGIGLADRRLSIWPIGLALLGSVIVCLSTPIGIDIIYVPVHMASSLAHHGGHVMEFAPFYSSKPVLYLVILATGLALAGFWKSRRQWCPYELGLWLMSGVLVAVAVRGVVYFVPIGVGIFARSLTRGLPGSPGIAPGKRESALSLWLLLRLTMVGITVAMAVYVFQLRWVSPLRGLVGSQPTVFGLGRSLGDWPDAAIEFLNEHPPPGRLLNLGWYSGNALISGLYPRKKVFVDPRFEAYPREFLITAIEAERDDAVLSRLIVEWEPSWIVAEVRLSRVRQRMQNLLAAGRWALVYADTIFLVLVRVPEEPADEPELADYLEDHRLEPEQIDPADLLEDEPDLLGLQLVRLAGLFLDLNLPAKAEEMLDRARPLADRHGRVNEAIEFYQRAVAVKANDAIMRQHLGMLLMQQKPPQARVHLESSGELDPGLPEQEPILEIVEDWPESDADATQPAPETTK